MLRHLNNVVGNLLDRLFDGTMTFIDNWLPLLMTGGMVIGFVWGACYILDNYGR